MLWLMLLGGLRRCEALGLRRCEALGLRHRDVHHPGERRVFVTGRAAISGWCPSVTGSSAELASARTRFVRTTFASTALASSWFSPWWSRANVAYPTDSGLLAKAARRIGSTVKRTHSAGGAVRTQVRDRSRSAGAKAHGVTAKLRSRAQLGRDEAKAGVQKITGELADLAEQAINETRKLLVNTRRAADRARAEAPARA